jgi:hypothetical protein
MLIRIDVLAFAMLICPLVFAGMASSGFYYHPPRTWNGVVFLLIVIGLPLYFAGIVAHYKLFKEKGRDPSGYSRAFPIVLIVAGYILGTVFGVMIFR